MMLQQTKMDAPTNEKGGPCVEKTYSVKSMTTTQPKNYAKGSHIHCKYLNLGFAPIPHSYGVVSRCDIIGQNIEDLSSKENRH